MEEEKYEKSKKHKAEKKEIIELSHTVNVYYFCRLILYNLLYL